MGTYTFKWPNPGESVFVTGTFDDWKKTVQLEKVGNGFEKTVTLPDSSDKIYYKFVVDGEWIVNQDAPKESDATGNENNVLIPEDIVKSAPVETAVINSVAPESTTVALAKDVPLEKKDEPAATLAETAVLNSVAPESTTVELAKDAPLEKREEPVATPAETPAETAILNSVAPESTTVELAKDVPLEKKEEPAAAPVETAVINSVAPESTTVELAKDVPLEKKEVPAATAAPVPEVATAEMSLSDNNDTALPGTFPETPAAELEKEVKISPLPASDGAVNPVKLAPGEPVPESLKSGDINANVKLDPESYEKADTLVGVSTSLPPVSGNMIPESSLPIAGTNDVTISSVGANATTLGLAAQAPLEPKAPAIVKESQEKAGVDPEASAIPAEVKEKEAVESELLDKVPEAPSTSEGTAGKGTEKSENDKTIVEAVTAAAVGITGAAIATAVAAKDSAVEQASAAAAQLPDSVKQNLPASVHSAIAPTAKEEVLQEVSPEVPAEVKESIQEAGASAEAAANTVAVEEKKQVEAELLKEVKAVAAVGEEEAKKTEEKVEKKVDEVVTAVTNGKSETAAESAAAKAPETAAADKTTEGAASTTTPAPASDSSAAKTQKKKNRLSTMFSKLKSKVSSKESK